MPGFLAALLALPLLAGGVRSDLRIVATTDLHCQLVPEGRAGGIPKVTAVVQRLREEGPTVLVDVGDAFEGGPAGDYYARVDTTAPHPLAVQMNRLGYAAMALGNHEFTYGMGFLRRLAEEASFPLLSANAAPSGGVWHSHALVQVGPFRVLVIGVTTPWTEWAEGPWLDGVRFADPIPAVRRLVHELSKREKPDVVCVLAHMGWGHDQAADDPENLGSCLAALPGIDVLFLGHTHTTLQETRDRTLVLQAGSRGSTVAVARLSMERRGFGWRVEAAHGELVAPDASVDSVALSLGRAAMEPVSAWLSEEVATLPIPLSARDGALRLDGVTHLLGTVMREAGGGDVALVPLPPDRLAFSPGPVHRRELFDLQPCLNRLVTVRLAASDLSSCLEHASSAWAAYGFDGARLPSPGKGKEAQVLVADGLSYVIDATAPPGSRLAWVRRRGRPLGDSLDVVVTSYHASGAGGYSLLRDARVVRRSTAFLRDLLPPAFTSARDPSTVAERWWSLPTYRGTWVQVILDGFLARTGGKGYVGLDWDGSPSLTLAHRIAHDVWEGEIPPALSRALSHPPLTRGRVLSALARSVPRGACTPNAAASRFADVSPGPHPSVWDSVVSSGLVAFLPDDSLRPEAAVTTAELAAFLVHGRYRALTVAASNDFHGQLERTPKRGFGGIEAMASWVKASRKANPEGLILLDAGDAMQGSPLSNLFHGSSTIHFYRLLGYDALSVGNHDFDWGLPVLRARIQEAGFPFLGANVLEVETGEPPPWLAPYTIIDRGGVRTVVIGFATPETPWVTLADHVAGLSFEEPGFTLDRLWPTVRDSRPDLVVVLAHLGLEETGGEMVGGAAALTEAASGRAHVFFNGHTHQTYAATIAGLPHLQGGSHGKAFSVARAWVDRLGRDPPWVVCAIEPLDPSMRHPEVASLVEEFRRAVAPKTEVVITELASPISREANEAGESPMGRLIAESQRWMARVPIALMNAGGVRADVDEGPVTWQELFTVQPFGNTLVKVTLSGRDLLATLEQGTHPGGTILQVAGIDVWINPARSFGQRVVRATLEDGSPIDPSGEYQVVVNNFMASGGDGFTVLRDSARKYDTGIVDLDAMIAYLKTFPVPVDVKLPPRVHLVRPE